MEALTKPIKAGNDVLMIAFKNDKFVIMKVVINYVRGKNVKSWRVRGSASSFENLDDCVSAFSKIVNSKRKETGMSEINFKIEK